jgi:glycosyltransferase involved in cell wall biosynthesis
MKGADLIADLDLAPHVTFHGIVHDMPGFYRGIDVFLCPSLREPFGSVCLEAAAWGCVVVASRVDGLVEAVEPADDYPFLMAVQWHPEEMVSQPEQRKLFEQFVAKCREAAAQRK